MSKLEGSLIAALGRWGLAGARNEHTGVWVGDTKVAALGVHILRGLTAHGCALNCDVDLAWFSHIVPCGIADKGVASISSLRSAVDPATTISDAAPVVTAELAAILTMVPAEPVHVRGADALLASLGLAERPL